MFRLFFASFFTLAILSSFVCGLVILALLFTDIINIWLAVFLTITINLLMWLFGPTLTDLINKWFYKVRFLKQEEVRTLYPHVADIIQSVSQTHRFKFPKVGIIPDKNPTAFTYGTARYNARIVLTEGMFHYLNPQEVKAVVAHELGHIVHRDFMVMMIASTFVQILYEIYHVCRRARGKRAGGAKLVGLVAYILYSLSIYLLYYLSRTREYLADEFSARVTEPADLANALIKIAYGIVEVDDSDKSKQLLQSTRHLGIIDVKNAKHTGVASFITNADANLLAEVMVFDKLSPWAMLVELGSTHPLTGKRIDRLSNVSKKLGKAFSFDVTAAIARMNVRMSTMYLNFIAGLCILALPMVTAAISIFVLPVSLVPGVVGFALLAVLLYKFPLSADKPSTVLEMMRNPYASPIRGKPVSFQGQVIGRGVPGFIFSEDMMYQDKTGLIFLNYSSIFGFLGNIFFALKKIKMLFNQPSQVGGWFFRGMGSSVSLKYVRSEQHFVRSHPILWSLVMPALLITASIYMFFVLGITERVFL